MQHDRRDTPRHPGSSVDWESLPEERLMDRRIRDLGLRIEGSPLEARIEQLYAELDACGITFRPPCYLADEWFCPDRVPVIAIPFCLAHPRLKRIEQRMMFEVEGGSEEACMKLLRHEAGHCMNYAYRLYRRTRWRDLFGNFSKRYSTTYRFYPYSKRYVLHLQDNYAQAHPDEDFAETFAVWLTPGSGWESRYRDWPVMPKLRYIDNLVHRLGRVPPPVAADAGRPWSADRMTSTLAAYYRRKRADMGDAFAGYYDPMLRRLFVSRESRPDAQPAARFLRLHQRGLVNSVAAWTGRRKYDIYQFVSKMIRRCEMLDLGVASSGAEAVMATAVFVTAATRSLDSRMRSHIEE